MITKAIRAGALVLATAVAGGLMTSAPAHAQGSYEGKVISKTNLSVRYGPSSATKRMGSVKPGKVIPLHCKVRGSSVGGNDIWYALPPTFNEWVSARYVDNVGAAPDWCGNSERFVGRTTAKLTKRAAPTSASAAKGSYNSGAGVDIICKLKGQNVSGNNLWYWTTGKRWVAARYVDNVGRAPHWCN